ncbi:hypothetical protein B9T38_10335 [Acinetobacter sp. ANC 4218]|nr:hypothetical protein B9T38_10335 [Acinetobacter sp. ANC 4218]
MLFSVFYVGDSCQGWGREFESPFPLQIQKSPHRKMGAFLFYSHTKPYKSAAFCISLSLFMYFNCLKIQHNHGFLK